jgi:hypothetical protein
MQMLVLIIWHHMLLITMAKLMKFQRGMQVHMPMIRPHMLPIIIAEFMKNSARHLSVNTHDSACNTQKLIFK